MNRPQVTLRMKSEAILVYPVAYRRNGATLKVICSCEDLWITGRRGGGEGEEKKDAARVKFHVWCVMRACVCDGEVQMLLWCLSMLGLKVNIATCILRVNDVNIQMRKVLSPLVSAAVSCISFRVGRGEKKKQKLNGTTNQREERRGISALDLTQVNGFYRGGNTCMHSCALYKMPPQDDDDCYNMSQCVYMRMTVKHVDGSIFFFLSLTRCIKRVRLMHQHLFL